MPFESHGFVAHAGGSPEGLLQTDHYSNSREAFEASYENGFRAFEFDLITLGDGTVVVAHDHDEAHYGLDVEFSQATRADLEGALWDGKYPVMFAQDLIDLMVAHPTVWVILDTKWDHVAIAAELVRLSPDASVTDRMVPHMASSEHTLALRDVYPFPERMLAGYRWRGSDDAMLNRMALYSIDNVMLWWDARWSEHIQSAMDDAGHHVWVHTPEEPETIEEFRARGVGVYTNGYITCP